MWRYVAGFQTISTKGCGRWDINSWTVPLYVADRSNRGRSSAPGAFRKAHILLEVSPLFFSNMCLEYHTKAYQHLVPLQKRLYSYGKQLSELQASRVTVITPKKQTSCSQANGARDWKKLARVTSSYDAYFVKHQATLDEVRTIEVSIWASIYSACVRFQHLPAMTN